VIDGAAKGLGLLVFCRDDEIALTGFIIHTEGFQPSSIFEVVPI
jgi:hypothetical protein